MTADSVTAGRGEGNAGRRARAPGRIADVVGAIKAGRVAGGHLSDHTAAHSQRPSKRD